MEKYSKIRKTTQLTSLAISAVIFAVALHGIITHNDFYFEIGLLLIGFIIVGGLLLSPILGRFWCGWLCPRGTFLEYVMEKISHKASIPKTLKTTGFKLFIASIMAIMFLIVLLGKNPLLVSQDKLASIGGFIVFICIVTTLLISTSRHHLHAADLVQFLPCGVCAIPSLKEQDTPCIHRGLQELQEMPYRVSSGSLQGLYW